MQNPEKMQVLGHYKCEILNEMVQTTSERNSRRSSFASESGFDSVVSYNDVDNSDFTSRKM